MKVSSSQFPVKDKTNFEHQLNLKTENVQMLTIRIHM